VSRRLDEALIAIANGDVAAGVHVLLALRERFRGCKQDRDGRKE
jgi:hypothetical protein